jgi:hypothetical protein
LYRTLDQRVQNLANIRAWTFLAGYSHRATAARDLRHPLAG